MTFKSPELQIFGKIVSVKDTSNPQQSSFYLKVNFIEGEDWSLVEGINKFQTYQCHTINQITPIQQQFILHYITKNIRGWPRMLIQVWKVDSYGRHNIYGYGTLGVPMASGQYKLTIPCWRPMGTWYDRFIGANSQLQYPGIVCSSLSRQGLRTFSSCLVNIQINIIGRNFHLQGAIRDASQKKQQVINKNVNV